MHQEDAILFILEEDCGLWKDKGNERYKGNEGNSTH